MLFRESVADADPWVGGTDRTVLPARLEAAIASVAEHFGDATLAVRSSAVREDLPHASFAGQYDTVLGVRTAAALRSAVLSCWTSAVSERVRSYQPAAAAPSPLAVMVQLQLVPNVAGVAFTADPITGDRSKVLVSAVPGLGDALVSGRTAPDEWVVTGASATARRVDHQAMTAEQAVAVATLARRVEAFTGRPQDIEWAMVSAGLTGMVTEFGAMIEQMDCRQVGGEMYLRITPFGPGQGQAPPWYLLGALARVTPALRRRMRTARRMASRTALSGMVERWYSTWRPQLQEQARAFRAVNLSELDDPGLAAYLGDLKQWIASAMLLHFWLMPPHLVPLYTLAITCRRLLGWDTGQALSLVAGGSAVTSEPATVMSAIAADVARRPSLVADIRAGADPQSALRAESSELADRFDDWLNNYAYRTVSDDPGSATLLEQPALLARLLTDTTGSAQRVVVGQREARAQAQRALASESRRARRAFATALADASASYELREDVAFWTGSTPGGLIRLGVIEAGGRLTARGPLDEPPDAVSLDIELLLSALTGRHETDPREAVATAGAERAWARNQPGPQRYGPPPQEPPDLRGLPRIARRLNEALMFSRAGAAPASAAPDPAGADQLHRVAGSPGRYTGPVRLILSEVDFASLMSGDVLVISTTDPAWSPSRIAQAANPH